MNWNTFTKLKTCLVLVATMWLVYGLEWLVPSLERWGLVPRTSAGLTGIVSMHFLHGSLGHLMSNTVPMIVLLILLVGSRKDALRLVCVIAFTSAALLWVVGRPNNHIGASVLVYGLITFLLTSGLVEKRLTDITISVLVLILFGGSLLWGMLPSWNSHISWEGHLCGAIAGVGLAYLNRRPQVASKEPRVE
jgi:membrane associated rhomboid family serine protease